MADDALRSVFAGMACCVCGNTNLSDRQQQFVEQGRPGRCPDCISAGRFPDGDPRGQPPREASEPKQKQQKPQKQQLPPCKFYLQGYCRNRQCRFPHTDPDYWEPPYNESAPPAPMIETGGTLAQTMMQMQMQMHSETMSTMRAQAEAMFNSTRPRKRRSGDDRSRSPREVR